MDVEYMSASQLLPLDDPGRACQVGVACGVMSHHCLGNQTQACCCQKACNGFLYDKTHARVCTCMQAMLRGLDSSDWTAVVGALTTARQLVAHHPSTLLPHL
jgi:hypothetical protein